MLCHLPNPLAFVMLLTLNRKRVLKVPSYFPPVERFSRFAGALDVGRDY